jgi:heme-degrading monooxygenase HmoA
MPTINENGLFTVLIEFEVDPGQQQALIDAIADQVERHFKGCSGFVSTSFHASDDGRRVVNYAKWLSKEAWVETFGTGSDEVQAAIGEVIGRCDAKTLKIDTFHIARVVENR